ncbi:MAG: hypothetical protein LVS60_15830 [Nodosilinea sp. LVE1205-7]
MTTPTSTPMEPTPMTAQVTPSQAPSELASSQLVYALGTLGYDFGSEARRDTFKQLMPAFDLGAAPWCPPTPTTPARWPTTWPATSLRPAP